MKNYKNVLVSLGLISSLTFTGMDSTYASEDSSKASATKQTQEAVKETTPTPDEGSSQETAPKPEGDASQETDPKADEGTSKETDTKQDEDASKETAPKPDTTTSQEPVKGTAPKQEEAPAKEKTPAQTADPSKDTGTKQTPDPAKQTVPKQTTDSDKDTAATQTPDIIRLQCPTEYPFMVIDDNEGGRQLSSQIFYIINDSNVDILFDLSDIRLEPNPEIAYQELSEPVDASYASDSKDVFGFLKVVDIGTDMQAIEERLQNMEFPLEKAAPQEQDYILTGVHKTTDYKVPLRAANYDESGNFVSRNPESIFAFYIAGSVTPNTQLTWQHGDISIKLMMRYSPVKEETPPPAEASPAADPVPAADPAPAADPEQKKPTAETAPPKEQS